MPNVNAPKNASYRGWFYDGLNGREEAFTDGTEAFRMAKVSGTSRVQTSFVQSSAETTGLLNTVDVLHTQTAASTTNQIEALRVILTANVKTGEWANAFFARLDYSTDGYAHGLGSVICAELSLPGSSVSRGVYYAWQTEINCPANCAMNGNPIAVMSVSVWGDNKTQFDDVGLLFDISGVQSGDGKFWYDSTSAAADEFIKVRTPAGIRYLVLSDSSTFN